MHIASTAEMDTLVTKVFAQKFTTLLRGLAMDMFGNTDVMVFNHFTERAPLTDTLICAYDSTPRNVNISAKDVPAAEQALKDRSMFAIKLSELLSDNGISCEPKFLNETGKGLCSISHPRVSFLMNAENVGAIDTINQKLAEKRQHVACTDTPPAKPVKAEDFLLVFIKGGPANACTPA